MSKGKKCIQEWVLSTLKAKIQELSMILGPLGNVRVPLQEKTKLWD